MSIKPTMSVPIFGGKVTVHAFGREHGCNFSFKGIDDSANAHETHKHVFEALASIPSSTDFFAPSPTQMNAEIVEPGAVTSRMWKYDKLNGSNLMLYRGGHADGVSHLHRWCSYAMSAADCALIVAKSGNLIVAAHAGRDSIIDMSRMKGGERRQHESVVETICTSVFEPLQIKDMEVWVGFSISPGPHFQHVKGNPRYPHNEKMVVYITTTYGKECFADDGQGGALGWLDTKELIRRQFIRFGVPKENITLDSVCTYSDVDDLGNHIWFSNVRNTQEGKDGRNLVAVVVQK